MVRLSKQEKRRSRYPRKRKLPGIKTGSLKDRLELGFKPQENALIGSPLATSAFVPLIK